MESTSSIIHLHTTNCDPLHRSANLLSAVHTKASHVFEHLLVVCGVFGGLFCVIIYSYVFVSWPCEREIKTRNEHSQLQMGVPRPFAKKKVRKTQITVFLVRKKTGRFQTPFFEVQNRKNPQPGSLKGLETLRV